MKSHFDYVNILAGGVCPIGCSFCVGQKIRKNVKPCFASLEKIKVFLEVYEGKSKLLSISGSTSDPLFVENIPEVIKLAEKKFDISLHTCASKKILDIDVKPFIEICISLHDYPDKELTEFIRRNKDKVRISSVYNQENKRIFDDLSFFDKVPCKSFTLRKNVFDPMNPKFMGELKKIGEIFNQPVYQYKDKEIVVWDFADANKYIDARYLWPDGQIRRQCYWHELHKK